MGCVFHLHVKFPLISSWRHKLNLNVTASVVKQWFGHYSYGHQGGVWNYNEVHDNVGYGEPPRSPTRRVPASKDEALEQVSRGKSLKFSHEP